MQIRVDYRTGPALDIPQFPIKDMWGRDRSDGMGPRIQLGWQPPEDSRIEAAARLAAESDAAVVVVGVTSGEGADRPSLGLPGDQDALISAIAAANPRTIVVLNTPGAVLMPWLDDVGAVLEAWYPGEQFGAALASVLFGDADPGGRLPVTFPAAEEHGPITGPERYPGIDGVARYDEGILVGYRWFDAHEDQPPLFPFGHGLSYGAYSYHDLTVERDDGTVRVGVDVTNEGDRAGSEVVQLYVAGPPDAEAPPRELTGFRKVRLDSGERARVTFDLPSSELPSYSEAQSGWVVHPGRYGIEVGASSRDIRCRGEVDLPRHELVRARGPGLLGDLVGRPALGVEHQVHAFESGERRVEQRRLLQQPVETGPARRLAGDDAVPQGRRSGDEPDEQVIVRAERGEQRASMLARLDRLGDQQPLVTGVPVSPGPGAEVLAALLEVRIRPRPRDLVHVHGSVRDLVLDQCVAQRGQAGRLARAGSAGQHDREHRVSARW